MTSDDYDARMIDGRMIDDIVSRLTPEELNHTLATSPHWEDERAGDLTVFHPADGGSLVVYDPEEERFLPESRYTRTMSAVRRAAVDEDGAVEMASAIDGAVANRDVLIHLDGDRGRRSRGTGTPSTMGFAADGLGYTLARVRSPDRGTSRYAVIESRYTGGGAERVVTGDHVAVDRTDVPRPDGFFHNKVGFLDDHLLSRYAPDRREEVLDRLADEYDRSLELVEA